ncbi:SDR family NAD(P)-dependent oxidoreductase [Mesorhizobium sp. M0870]|uniref:SDR family NAD(P)-dependent oxidoreductase n=1 Tax=Mesorhizobium sp. M0870 TaxID=2957016 RepID=UPI00333C8CA8
MCNFSGKAALVTGVGGKGGIGRAIAIRFARDGADVAVTALRPVGSEALTSGWRGAASVADEIGTMGRRSIATFGDISDAAAVDRLIEESVAALGRIDIFVANAASAPGSDRVPVIDLREEDFDLVQRVNVKGTFLCCRAVARHMLARGGGGRIVIMSSGLGKRGLPRNSAYSASKFAVNGLAQCLAHELAPEGITVNAVCPGTVETERLVKIAEGMRESNETVEERLNKTLTEAVAETPLGRLGTVSDVASLVAFLASDEASFLTGLSISVSGGAVMI